jgi:hypothetical protein
MKKVIKFSLDAKGINQAIREVESFKQKFLAKVDVYRRRIAEEIAVQASLNFDSSVIDDTVKNGTRKPDVTVNVDERGSISVVVADGEDAVWCEFGAGVYHNGSAGSSPNPYGGKLGLTIGSYGKGFGKQQAWGYYDESGELIITRGTPASMPMYNAVQSVTIKAITIAREVFG